MPRLITDQFTRRVSQVLTLLIFLALTILPLAIILVAALQRFGLLGKGLTEFALLLLTVVSLPLGDSVAQLTTVLVATFPVIVAVVCFERDLAATPPKSRDKLNPIGEASVIILLVGAAASFVAFLIFNANIGLIVSISQNEAEAKLVKGVIGGMLTFQIFYILRLLGLEKTS